MSEHDIEYQDGAPCFLTKDGRFFVVKKLYGRKTATFYPGEFERILSDVDRTTILLFDDLGVAPVKQVPARVLLEDRYRYGEYQFVYIEPRHAGEGPPGQIVVPFTRRNSTSRYWRNGHAPVDSMAMWPRGEYEFTKSIDGTGRLKLFLVLRPTI